MPQDLATVLIKEKEIVKEMEQKINCQKDDIKKLIAETIEIFTTLCNKKKDDLINQFDEQLWIFKTNFSLFRQEIKKFYGVPIHAQDNLDAATNKMISDANELETSEEFQIFINNLKCQIENLEHLKACDDDKLSQHRESIKNLSMLIKDQIDLKPRVNIDNAKAYFTKLFDDNLTNFFEIDFYLLDSVQPITLQDGINSVILKNSDEVHMLKGWLNEHSSDVSFKLLYRAQGEDCDLKELHSMWKDVAHTVILAKSKEGVVGGYSDQSWELSEAQKFSSAAFIFSITNKEKYVKHPKVRGNLLSSETIKIAFGETPDFMINQVGNNHCELTFAPCSFRNQEIFCLTKPNCHKNVINQTQCIVKEVEVFQVSYPGIEDNKLPHEPLGELKQNYDYGMRHLPSLNSSQSSSQSSKSDNYQNDKEPKKKSRSYGNLPRK